MYMDLFTERHIQIYYQHTYLISDNYIMYIHGLSCPDRKKLENSSATRSSASSESM